MAQSTKTSAPWYISGLRFENLKCFSGVQTLSFLDRDGRPSMWNLLLGENGVGKTTVLQCLTWMRPVEGAKPYDFIQPALANAENSVYEKLVRIGTRELVVKAEFCKRNTYGKYKPILETGFEAVLKRNGKLKDAYPLDPKRRGKKPPDIQIIAYSANRLAGHLNLSEDNIADPVSTIFETGTTLYDPEAILMNLDHAALKDKTETANNRRDQVKNLVAAILPYVAKPKDIRIGGPRITGGSTERSGVHFKTPDGIVPFSSLSLGYQTTLAWALDLAFRMIRKNPKSKNPFGEPAIVLVDEIDLPGIHRHFGSVESHLSLPPFR